MKMDIKAWSKTPDGIAMVDSQKVFCIGTQLWQGFKGCAIRAMESQMQTRELQEVARERDIDDSMKAVWFRRTQRMESRFSRKAAEYDARGAVLRRERNEVRQNVREDKSDGLPPSPADLRTIRRIDKRMERLNLLHEEEEARLAALHERAGPNPDPALLTDERELTPEQLEGIEDVPEHREPTAMETTCDWPGCEKTCPPDSKDPVRWLRMHRLGAHIGPETRAKKKAALQEAATEAHA